MLPMRRGGLSGMRVRNPHAERWTTMRGCPECGRIYDSSTRTCPLCGWDTKTAQQLRADARRAERYGHLISADRYLGIAMRIEEREFTASLGG